jgi:hypothetical protein
MVHLGSPVVLRLSGQLGNHLFQFAAAMAVGGGTHPVLTDSGMLTAGRRDLLRTCLVDGATREANRADRLRARIMARGQVSELVERIGHGVDRRVLEAAPPLILQGYFNDERYFSAVRQQVRAAFRPASATSRNWFGELVAAGRPVAAIGYRQAQDYAELGYVLPDEFYVSALTRLQHPVGSYTVAVFGDDARQNMAAARRVVGADAALVSAHHLAPVDQLNAMSLFEELVIPNSTFSWWGAWLADQDRGARVLAPNPWVYVDNELVPDRWMRVERAGGLTR